jgi:UDP-4-amino-4,6-dideoxy-N-acetyl-beta-L-altrosamine N-acetyltransferase
MRRQKQVDNTYVEALLEIYQERVGINSAEERCASKKKPIISLKNFIDLTKEEKEMILSWRNHEDVRNHMYNDAIISIENHEAFINSLQHGHDKIYMLVFENYVPIGVIDLVNITERSASPGLYTNPFADRGGIGQIILPALMHYAYEVLHLSKLNLECFEDNKIAQNLYKKFHFVLTERSTKRNKPTLCMEHNYECWHSQSQWQSFHYSRTIR